MFNYKVKLSSKVSLEGKSQIFIRIDITRSFRPQLKTGIFVRPEIFDIIKNGNIEHKYNRLNGNLQNKEVQSCQKQLETFVNWLMDLTKQAIAKKTCITTTWLQEMIDLRQNCLDAISRSVNQSLNPLDLERDSLYRELPKGEVPVYEYCRRFIAHKGLNGTYRNSYENLAKVLVRYELLRKYLDSDEFRLTPDEITSNDIEDIRKYLKEEYTLVNQYPSLYGNIDKAYQLPVKTRVNNNSVKKRGDNSIRQMLHHLSMVWNWLLRENITSNNPWSNVTIGAMVYSTPIYISNEERDHIANYDLSNECQSLQETRDIFIFQSLVGCRVSDLNRLTEDNINGDFLEYIPYKTRHLSQRITPRVPLVAQAKSILVRYADFRKKDPNRRLLPFKPISVYNLQIKQLFKICGITRTVSVIDCATGEVCMRHIDEIASSHMARRTFAGNIYSKVQDPNIVGKMTGHIEGSRAFARYRKIDDKVLLDAVKAIETGKNE